jgi:radical SAM superfamily enzyme YgiQ (UPF0313 family)
MKRKLVLVSPHPPGNVGQENVSVLPQMPLCLAYLKTLTPEDRWEVDIVDEMQEPALNADETDLTFGGADLVAITAMSHQARRSYKLAEVCRRRKIPTVIGGVHVTAYPKEAAQFVDAVCVREAFSIWPKIIDDVETGNLQRFYDGGLNDLGILRNIRPDRDFLQQKYRYRYTSAIASSGCPYACEFCFVPLFQGRKYRERPVEDILNELDSFKGKYRGMSWSDENFYGHNNLSHQRCVDLYRGMVERGMCQKWFGCTSIHISEDPEVLHWMAESGSVGMLIGFESIEPETLKLINKKFNMRRSSDGYRQAIENIHKHGLAVWASMLFATDNDTPQTFDGAAEFVLRNEIDIMTCGLETPAPGTPYYRRLDAEGRIFRNDYPYDYELGNAYNLMHVMKSLTLQELIDGLEHLYNRLYTTEMLRKRFANSGAVLQNMNAAMFAFRVNLDWQKVFRHLIENLRKLQASGDYERALERRKGGSPHVARG